ncbi:MAG: prepilin-type N-terminal cleavage/methylation domain-containing protein [Opitutales bacterium]
MKNLKNKKSKGFTLVEVMLAVGVITISLTALLSLLGAITSSVAKVRQQAKALTVIDHVQSTLKIMEFEDVYGKVNKAKEKYLIYFWDEYENPDDLKNTSLILCSSEDAGRDSEQAPRGNDLLNVVGNVFRVELSLNYYMLKDRYIDANSDRPYMAGASLPGDYKNYIEAYLPLYVDIFADPKSNILGRSATEEENDTRRVMEDTIMKMR